MSKNRSTIDETRVYLESEARRARDAADAAHAHVKHVQHTVRVMRVSLVVALLGILAWIVLALISTPAHRTVDPSRYFPVANVNGNENNGVLVVFREHFTLALTVTIALAIALPIFVISANALLDDAFAIPALTGGALFALTIIAGVTNTCVADTYDGAFATWAKDRYGIELQSPPTKNISIWTNGEINTDRTVVLRDGHTVRIEMLSDQDGQTVLAVVDADKTAHELPVITDH